MAWACGGTTTRNVILAAPRGFRAEAVRAIDAATDAPKSCRHSGAIVAEIVPDLSAPVATLGGLAEKVRIAPPEPLSLA